MSEDLRLFVKAGLPISNSNSNINRALVAEPNSIGNASQLQSQQNSYNIWIKMSECDEFIGPKRSKHTMVAHGNSLYVFGGDNGKQMLNDIISYDCNNNSWGRALNGSPPTPRYHHTAVVHNNSMFVFGGYTGDLNSNSNLCNKNDLYEYRFSTGNWVLWNTECAPAARAAHGAVVYDNKLWVFAGYDGNARLNDMWHISLTTPPQNSPKVWTEVEQLGDQPSTVCNSPLAVVHDSMYLFSGQSGAKTSNHLFKFDFKTFRWTKMVGLNFILRGTNNPPERRSGHIMVAYDNRLYIYGGVLGNSFFNEIYSFDLETKTWDLITMSPKSPIPSGRSFLAAAIQNNYLYVFGGNGEENSRSNELHRFKLPNQPKSTLRDDFYTLLKEELASDLKFTLDNQVIMAHCAIVAARSSYCRQLIKQAKEKTIRKETACLTTVSNSTRSSSDVNQDEELDQKKADEKPPFVLNPGENIEIKINKTENAKALNLLLEFLYTDRIISLEGRENELETIKLIVDVYKLAVQFSIAKLKRICESFFDSSITCSNVLSLLRYVDQLNLNTLKDFCMRFLIKDTNYQHVIMSSDFEQVNAPLIVEIVRLKQTPRQLINLDQINDMVLDQNASLEQDLEAFFRKDIGKDFSDILIYVDEHSPPIYGHMCILAARCAYFEAYFRSFMPKDRKIFMANEDTVLPKQACLSLLNYIYYDDLNMPPQNALYLFSASHYFQFSNLRLYVYCKQNLEANVSKNNVFDILEAADKIRDENMKAFALKIVRNNFCELARSQRIKRLSKELLLDIIEDIGSIFMPKLNTTASSNSSSFNTLSSLVISTNTNNATNLILPTFINNLLPSTSNANQLQAQNAFLNYQQQHSPTGIQSIWNSSSSSFHLSNEDHQK